LSKDRAGVERIKDEKINDDGNDDENNHVYVERPSVPRFFIHRNNRVFAHTHQPTKSMNEWIYEHYASDGR